MAQRIIIPALNYDQQSMPPNPGVGQTWRERDSSNNVLGNWFWNGAYWLSQETKSFPFAISGASANFNTSATFNFANNYNIFIQRFAIIGRIEGATSPGGAIDSNTNYWVFSLGGLADGGQGSQYTQTISLQGLIYAQYQNIYRQSIDINSFIIASPSDNYGDGSSGSYRTRGFSESFTKTGSPPNLSGIGLVVQHRFAHP